MVLLVRGQSITSPWREFAPRWHCRQPPTHSPSATQWSGVERTRRPIQTTGWMEYQGKGWLNPDSNQIYSKRRVSTAERPPGPICTMEVEPKSPRSPPILARSITSAGQRTSAVRLDAREVHSPANDVESSG
jgi:hypothetical protein